jgi:hypothetical protein
MSKKGLDDAEFAGKGKSQTFEPLNEWVIGGHNSAYSWEQNGNMV